MPLLGQYRELNTSLRRDTMSSYGSGNIGRSLGKPQKPQRRHESDAASWRGYEEERGELNDSLRKDRQS